MTNGEKERFCAFAASIIAPPDGAMLDDLEQDELRTLIGECVRQWGGERQLPPLFVKEGNREDFLAVLQGEYERLFGQWEGERISLVESTYKPWTTDKGCGMVFAASKGLVMGDSALHMREIYRLASLEVPEQFRSMPDHLVLELEFLALLYRFGIERADRTVHRGSSRLDPGAQSGSGEGRSPSLLPKRRRDHPPVFAAGSEKRKG